jgi:hypothetical protein
MFDQPSVVGSGGAPRPVAGRLAETRSDRVRADVGACRGEMALVLDHAGREAVPEEVSGARVAAVEDLGVHPVQALEAGRETFPGRLDEDVVVRSHQAEGMAAPAVTARRLGEDAEKRAAVVVVTKHRRAVDSPGGDVVDAVGEVSSQHPRHAARMARRGPTRVPGTLSARFRGEASTKAVAAAAGGEGQTLCRAPLSATRRGRRGARGGSVGRGRRRGRARRRPA